MVAPVTCFSQETEFLPGAEQAQGESQTTAAQQAALPPISAATAIVIDRDTGAVLGAKNPDVIRPNPSTTKMMTALLALERNGANLDEIVGPISTKAAGTTGSRMNLNPGDSVSLRDLLYGLMLPSGNDAAVAIAEWISGSEEAFVALMNQRADSLGLTHTRYRRAAGYDSLEDPTYCVPPYSTLLNCGHYSTARDLATLARLALRQQPLFARFVQTVTWTPQTWFNASHVQRVVPLQNDNLLLSSMAYPGANGVKTGMTTTAGFCMVAGATRSGHSIISVVMGCDTNVTRHVESSALLDWGFSRLSGTTKGALLPVITLSVMPGSVSAGNDATFVISTSQIDQIQPTIVHYTMTGLAQVGTDFSLSGDFGEASIPAGASSTQVVLHSFNTPSQKKAKRAAMKLLPGTTYRLPKSKKATVTITGG
jgi:D-alanyl-D-alanine carboxypeptidase